MHRRIRPEIWAALVNGLAVLIVPLVFFAWADRMQGVTDTSSIVYARGPSAIPVAVQRLASSAFVLLPFALLAAWRTWVHAQSVIAGRSKGWQGVGEAVATGFGVLLLELWPALMRSPQVAPLVLIAYGVIVAPLGLVVGLLLRTTALFVVRLAGAPAYSDVPSIVSRLRMGGRPLRPGG